MFYQITKNETHTTTNKANKIGKRPGTMYCFGCEVCNHNFRPQKVKMKLKKNKTVLFVGWIVQGF